MGQQLPVSVVLNYRDGKYAIDADKSFDASSNANILSEYVRSQLPRLFFQQRTELSHRCSQGHLMEKLLTTDAKQFKRFLVDSEDPAPSEADQKQAYHYAMVRVVPFFLSGFFFAPISSFSAFFPPHPVAPLFYLLNTDPYLHRPTTSSSALNLTPKTSTSRTRLSISRLAVPLRSDRID